MTATDRLTATPIGAMSPVSSPREAPDEPR